MIPRSLLIAVSVLLLGVFGLGFYALHLKRKAEKQADFVRNQPVAPPTNAPMQKVKLMIAYDEPQGLISKREVELALPSEPQARALELLRALVAQYTAPGSPHRLAEGSGINDVFLVGRDIAVVNANAALADGHPSGILVEHLTLSSMARTLAANIPGVTRMKLIIDGAERETLAGHADLSTLYDVPSTQEQAKDPQ